MERIEGLNESLCCDGSELDNMIAELDDRQEFTCWGDACGANGCGIN